jgi:cytochrome c5
MRTFFLPLFKAAKRFRNPKFYLAVLPVFIGTILLGAALVPSARAQGPAPSPLEALFPEGNGKQLVVKVCQRCHSLDQVYESELWTYEWRATVQDMVRRGAILEGDDFETAVQYLSKNFRPSGPVRARVNLPEGEGKPIANANCQKCHSLRKLVNSRRGEKDWNDLIHVMIRQGATISEADIDPLVRYLTKNFGPDAKPQLR